MSKAGDPRLGSIITEGMAGDVVIVGFPWDEGCVRNGGRAGAAMAPHAFRQFLRGMGTVINAELGVDMSSIKIADSGDIRGETLEESHAMLEERVATILKNGGIPFVIGGGNDQSAPNGRGFCKAFGGDNTAVINIDAHLDVRPPKDGQVHSGTPFRELLEGNHVTGARFAEFACQGVQCSAEHAAYVEERGGKLWWFDAIEEDPCGAFVRCMEEVCPSASPQGKLFVSFDIDSVSSADCPGVSCPAAYGLSGRQAMKMCQAAGANPSVAMMDLSELNPMVENYRSPRLAVVMFYHFLVGLCKRPQFAANCLRK